MAEATAEAKVAEAMEEEVKVVGMAAEMAVATAGEETEAAVMEAVMAAAEMVAVATEVAATAGAETEEATVAAAMAEAMAAHRSPRQHSNARRGSS